MATYMGTEQTGVRKRTIPVCRTMLMASTMGTDLTGYVGEHAQSFNTYSLGYQEDV